MKVNYLIMLYFAIQHLKSIEKHYCTNKLAVCETFKFNVSQSYEQNLTTILSSLSH